MLNTKPGDLIDQKMIEFFIVLKYSIPFENFVLNVFFLKVDLVAIVTRFSHFCGI